MRVEYRLAETYFTVAGSVEFELDPYAPPETRKPGDIASIAIGLRADTRTNCVVDLDSGRGDDSFAVTRTVDDRLATVTFNTVGSGAKVVSAAASVIAFVGGLAASVLGVARGGGAIAKPGVAESLGKDVAKTEPTPDEKARADWDKQHPTEGARSDAYKALVTEAEDELVKARNTAVSARQPAEQLAALGRARRLEQVIAASRAELDRIDTFYRAWRTAMKGTRTEARAYDLAVHDLPSNGAPPDPAALQPAAKEVWDELGVIVQVAGLGDPLSRRPADADESQRQSDPRVTLITGARYVAGGAPLRNDEIRWRVPRPVRISIWRRAADNRVVLDSSRPALVVDEACREASVEIDERWFGEQSVAIAFGELGNATEIKEAEKGAVAAFADAFRAVPEQIAAGLETAKKVESTFGALRDARAERDLARLKRQLEVTQAELDAKGLAATSEDFARLKRLQQQVAIATAAESLAPPSELDELKEELELARTRAALEELTDRKPTADAIQSLDAEVADLAKRVAILEGKP